MFGEGEKFREGGYAPLYLLFPFPTSESLASYCGTGWRGVRGEVKTINQMQIKPPARSLDAINPHCL